MLENGIRTKIIMLLVRYKLIDYSVNIFANITVCGWRPQTILEAGQLALTKQQHNELSFRSNVLQIALTINKQIAAV